MQSEAKDNRRNPAKRKLIKKHRYSPRCGGSYLQTRSYNHYPGNTCWFCHFGEEKISPLDDPQNCPYRPKQIKSGRSYRFTRRFDLYKELKIDSFPIQEFLVEKRVEYQCSFCKKITQNKDEMQKHQNNTHFLEIPKLHQLVRVKKVYNRQSRISKIYFLPHRKSQTKVYQFYKCNSCSYTNSLFRAVQYHFKKYCKKPKLSTFSLINQQSLMESSSQSEKYDSNQNNAEYREEHQQNRFENLNYHENRNLNENEEERQNYNQFEHNSNNHRADHFINRVQSEYDYFPVRYDGNQQMGTFLWQQLDQLQGHNPPVSLDQTINTSALGYQNGQNGQSSFFWDQQDSGRSHFQIQAWKNPTKQPQGSIYYNQSMPKSNSEEDGSPKQQRQGFNSQPSQNIPKQSKNNHQINPQQPPGS